MTQSSATTAKDVNLPMEEGAGLPLPLVLDFSAVEFTDEQFVQFCSDNHGLRIELSAERELIVMPPANPNTGSKNHYISGELYIWSKQDGTGLGFDSSSGFTLPNGAVRAPDASWMSREKWDALPQEDRNGFSHIVPDFVVELRSPSDTLAMLQDKMEEYINNGVRMGWLIDPLQRRVHIYRPGQAAEILENPETISGNPVLAGFALNIQEIW